MTTTKVTASTTSTSPPSAALFVAWEHLERTCKSFNTAYMACKKEKRDPSACLRAGEALKQCSYGVLAHLHQKAPQQFDAYAQCLWTNSNALPKCRAQEKAFKEKCPVAEAGPDPRG